VINSSEMPGDFRLGRASWARRQQLPAGDWARERELCDETARRSGREFAGIAVPTEALHVRVVTTGPAAAPA